MLQIFKDTHYDFQGIRKYAYILSGSLILICLISIIIHGGFNYSIDFTGGLSIRVQFAKEVTEGEVRNALATVNYGDSEVKIIQEMGGSPEILIRAKESQTAGGAQHTIENALRQYFPGNNFDVRSVEIVGPKIGKELRSSAVWASLVTLIMILIYLTWRFEFIFGVGAIISLFHDAFVTIGIFSLLNKEISLNVVAAVLTILGYSINDTIVVYDRIRENLKKRTNLPMKDVINDSINETLSRSIITSGLTLIVVLGLLFLGGRVINDFAFAMTVGIISGSYSTIYIASPILLEWGKKELLRKKKTVRK